MLINTDVSTDSTAANLLAQRNDGGKTASPASPAAQSDSAASQMDPSLQRLTDLPAPAQDAQWLLDYHGAEQTTDALRQGFVGQPGTAMKAQANQLPQNVLSLLQSID